MEIIRITLAITVMLIYLGILINDHRKDTGYHKKAKRVQLAFTLILILINLNSAIDLVRVIGTFPESFEQTRGMGLLSQKLNFGINTFDGLVSLLLVICVIGMAKRNQRARKTAIVLMVISGSIGLLSMYKIIYLIENEFGIETPMPSIWMYVTVVLMLTIGFYFVIIKTYLSKMMIRFFDRDISADSKGRLQHMIEEIGDSADNE